MRGTALLITCLTFAATSAVAQVAATYAPLPSVNLPPDLDRVLRDYERAWQAGDAAALAALFTPDGFVPTRFGWVRGSAAVAATYANASGPLRLRALAFATGDTVGYIVGAYGYGQGAGAPDTGNFVLAVRRAAGGSWLIAADLDNGNHP
jgi:ketosteroid isomerase-like protein